ncbi:SUR7/PalI family-domain-containing protein [Annulohypoxylon maeteangense]|uniref:SUR7/PalI family-domain-containing protein n=1 Tax=Annulohypoxylon maeteangense TaxID=1927788 RepID=UPI0020083EFB|nr:SUR7/PalI family-domain-containing protein [Annulohypoxylon maeteangense]KAI0885547.1 SUR7/PalI family-domain-containing protein [Annulohypoxylon maeteangense]
MAFGSIPGFRKRTPATSSSPDANAHKESPQPSIEDQATLKRGTRTRRNAIIVSCFCYLVAVVFLVLVEIGNTKGTRVLGDIYFFKLDLSDILPQAVPTTLSLQNSIARTLGLHDFYQVGLWNFCEGYDTDGITHCSTPTTLYWFNPVDILLSELFSGASIALPSEVNDILTILRIASNIMFGFFLTGLLLDLVLIFLSPIVLYSRWWSLPLSILAFLGTLLVLIASALGTAMSLVFKYALTSQTDLNVNADVGTKMFAFMWIATGFTLIAFIIHAGLGCCCTSRRDIRTGRKGGKKLNQTPTAEKKEKKGLNLPKFGRKTEASG